MIWKPVLRTVLTLALVQLAFPARGASLAINFGADEPGGAGTAVVSGPAGAFLTGVWNNTTTATSSATNLNLDNNGVSLATTASVDWSSPNTWASTGRGEVNNTAPAGNDFNLMQGYLDTGDVNGQGVSITVNNVPAQLGASYDVAVYIKGGVNGRGGNYTIGGTTLPHLDTAAFDGTYEFGENGDWILFRGVTGSSFTLTSAASATGVRAPINGIEVISSLPTVVGDANGDDVVNISDFDEIRANFLDRVPAGSNGDLDLSTVVDLEDFRIWKTAFGGGGPSSVPEPSTVMLLFMGGAGLLLARRLRTRG